MFTFQALHKYKEGIDLIDHALNIPVQCPTEQDSTWDIACNLIQKLKRTRAEVLMRINTLKLKYDPPSQDNSPVRNQETNFDTPTTYGQLAQSLRELSVRDFRNYDISLVYTNDEAKLYYISPDGTVLSTTDYQELKIFAIEGELI